MMISNKVINVIVVLIVAFFIFKKVSGTVKAMKCDDVGQYSKDSTVFSVNVDFNKKYSEYSFFEKIVYKICKNKIDLLHDASRK